MVIKVKQPKNNPVYFLAYRLTDTPKIRQLVPVRRKEYEIRQYIDRLYSNV